MKIVVLYLVTMAFLMMIAINVTSCSMKKEQEETAAQKKEREMRNLQAAVLDSDITIKNTLSEEWKAFTDGFREQVGENERRMSEIRDAIRKGGVAAEEVYKRRMEGLHAANEELKKRVEEYGKPGNDWESFKKEFYRDINALRQSLKDFTVNDIASN